MRLRDMTWRGSKVWPPRGWAASDEPAADISTCAKGILRKVQFYKSPPPFPPNEIYLILTAKFEGHVRVGLIFGTLEHLESLYYKLNGMIGNQLMELEEIEID